MNLGRLTPPDFEHVAKYPLRTLIDANELTKPVPVAIGANWYTSFDKPTTGLEGTRYVFVAGKDPKNLGTVRGGHCFCFFPESILDALVWWSFYNQGQEGSCEGHGHARMMSLLNRHRYDAVWLYEQAKKIDGIQGAHEGTTNRAALEVLRTKGIGLAHGTVSTNLTSSDPPQASAGISAYRWATNVTEILAALQSPTYEKLGAIPFLNSWGHDYPHVTWMPLATIERLMSEDGEAGVVTDR